MVSPISGPKTKDVPCPSYDSKRDLRQEVLNLFKILRKIDTPSSIHQGPLKPQEFRYAAHQLVPLIRMQGQGTEIPTYIFLALAKKLRREGFPPPNRDTIGGRMLIHGNEEIRILHIQVAKKNPGLLPRHAQQQEIDLDRSKEEVYEALGFHDSKEPTVALKSANPLAEPPSC